MDSSKPYQSALRIRFASATHANHVKTVLEVDDELQPKRITKDFSVDGSSLVM
jgi:hypothetical protein